MSKQSDHPESDHPERRTNERRLICVAMDLEAGEKSKQTAVIHDMSCTGAYVLSRGSYQVGDELALTIHLSTDREGPSEETHGKVVRVDPVPLERSVYWTHGIAIEFVSPLDHLVEEIAALASQLESMGVKF